MEIHRGIHMCIQILILEFYIIGSYGWPYEHWLDHQTLILGTCVWKLIMESLCLVWRPWVDGWHLETLIREPWYLWAVLVWLLTLGLTETLIRWEEVLGHHIMHHQSSNVLVDHGNNSSSWSFDLHVYMLGDSSDPRPCLSIHTCAFYLVILTPLILSLWFFQVHRSIVIG